jgi:hypothetical protein
MIKYNTVGKKQELLKVQKKKEKICPLCKQCVKTARVNSWCILTEHARDTRRSVSMPGLSGVLHASLSHLISPIYEGNIENAWSFTVPLMDYNFYPLGLFS